MLRISKEDTSCAVTTFSKVQFRAAEFAFAS
jgi:hypothetical protein